MNCIFLSGMYLGNEDSDPSPPRTSDRSEHSAAPAVWVLPKQRGSVPPLARLAGLKQDTQRRQTAAPDNRPGPEHAQRSKAQSPHHIIMQHREEERNHPAPTAASSGPHNQHKGAFPRREREVPVKVFAVTSSFISSG